MDSGRLISSGVPFRASGGGGGQVLLFGGGGGFRSVGAPQLMIAAAAGVENGWRKQPLFLAAHVEELQLELGPDVDDVVDQLCGFGQYEVQHQGAPAEMTRPNKRRLTAEQVRALEASFEEEKRKLEPERKSELARRLGMAPRQVAVWFQNRRARWRAKQLERDLDRLRAAHEELLAGCDALVADNDRLRSQVTALTEKLQSKASPPTSPPEEHTAASSAMQAAVLFFQLDEAQLRETTGGAVPTLASTGEANNASFESYFAGAPSPPLSSEGDCGDDAMLLAAAAVEHGPGLVAEEDVDSWEWFWN